VPCHEATARMRPRRSRGAPSIEAD
jgi:hypothetical protein